MATIQNLIGAILFIIIVFGGVWLIMWKLWFKKRSQQKKEKMIQNQIIADELRAWLYQAKKRGYTNEKIISLLRENGRDEKYLTNAKRMLDKMEVEY